MNYESAINKASVGRVEFLNYTQSTFGRAITRGWIDSLLMRHQGKLFANMSLPKNPRLEVTRKFLEIALQCLKDHVAECIVELIFNLDEVEISEWEDRKKKMIVLVSMRRHAIHHDVHRSLKHVSTVICISAAGKSMTPFIVSSQVTSAVIARCRIMNIILVSMELYTRENGFT